jgi:hypothetical protein
MANKGYEVLVDELTVHKAVRPLQHPITGEEMGYQQGAGETWFLGEVIPPEAMNPEWAAALDSGDDDNPLYGDLSKVLKPSSDEPALNEAYRMGLPFEGYDDMDEDDILAAMRVLPSAAVMRIKDWEAAHEGRDAVANFNIGYGESPDDRQSGRLSQEEAEGDETKAVRAIRTRTAEEGEPVIPGEGITGTGDPQVAPGTAAAAEAEESSSGGGNKRSGGGRAGRRPRPQPKAPADESGSSSS